MEIKLTQRDIDAIAYKTALILEKRLRQQLEQPDMVSTAEAARILGISPDRMRRIADQYPHTKRGEGKQGRLMFDRKALIC